jgi:ankyrin repeat protein
LLSKHGTDTDTKTETRGTARHEMGPWPGDLDPLYTLLRRGADVNAGTEAGETPLHEAAVNGKDWVVQLLLGKGAR